VGGLCSRELRVLDSSSLISANRPLQPAGAAPRGAATKRRRGLGAAPAAERQVVGRFQEETEVKLGSAIQGRWGLRTCFAALTWALLAVAAARAQAPYDLYMCLHSGGAYNPACFDIGGRLVIPICDEGGRYFENYYGRVAWYPLLCVGPIIVSIETVATPDTRFPLYVEVVPLGPPPLGNAPGVCDNAPGNVILVVYGATDPCGTWESSQPTEITSVVPLGSLYAIRVFFLGSWAGYSPAMDCIRVTAQPVTSPVAQPSWGLVKGLYR
jgi:hypothetical protein